MMAARVGHEAVALEDGRVLVVGGDVDANGHLLPSTAEIFDPVKNTWELDPSPPPLPPPQTLYVGIVKPEDLKATTSTGTLTRLGDGRVLLLGGKVNSAGDVPDETAVFLRAPEGSWTVGQALPPEEQPRFGFTATLVVKNLQKQVLVAGGVAKDKKQLHHALLFDPDSGAWSLGGTMITQRFSHTATALDDGRVLVVGGRSAKDTTALANCEIYDPETKTWKPAAPLNNARWKHQAIKLKTGHVLVAGGTVGGFSSLSSAELYDPDKDRWVSIRSLQNGRFAHTLSLLDEGDVLAVGGQNPVLGSLDVVERFSQSSLGKECTEDNDCQSGYCVEGMCCNEQCNQSCHACSIKKGASKDGQCVDISENMCAPFRCNPDNGVCRETCSSVDQCIAENVCDPSGRCVPPPPNHAIVDDTSCSASLPQGERRGSPFLAGLALLVGSLFLRRRRAR